MVGLRLVVVVALALVWAFGLGAPSRAQSAAPKVYAVNFTAQWCPNCRVLNPAFAQALQVLDDPRLERVDFDVTDARENPDRYVSIQALAEPRNLIGVYEAWIGLTGLVVLAAADTGEPIACLSRLQSAQAMVSAMRAALRQVEQRPAFQRFSGAPPCPGL